MTQTISGVGISVGGVTGDLSSLELVAAETLLQSSTVPYLARALR